MQNKIINLNNHLFAQLERLGDESLTQEELDLEINHSTASGWSIAPAKLCSKISFPTQASRYSFIK